MTEQNMPPESPAEAPTPEGAGQGMGDRQERRDVRVRGRLREVEQDRDALRQRYDRLVEREVHRLLGEQLTDVPMALRAGGKAPADFVNADGAVDADQVAKFATEILTTAPGFRRGLPVVTGDGQRHLNPPRPQQRGARWSDVFAADRGSSED